MNNDINSFNPFGEKLVLKRPPTIAVTVQIIHSQTQTKKLSVDFGQWIDNKPDFSQKKSLRLNIGESAMLLACIVGYIPKCRAGFRESGLFLNIDKSEKDLNISMYDGKTKVGYIVPTESEQYQIYQLGLQVMKRDGMSSKDTLDEFNFYFEQYCKRT